MQMGWNVVIETTNGNVGLWTNALEDGFKIFYPRFWGISNETIRNILEVNDARYEVNSRIWAEFCSERFDDLSRVWIQHEESHSFCHVLRVIENKQIKNIMCGLEYTNTIAVYPFNFWSEKQPDAPSTKSEHVQLYKEKFVQLLVEIAKELGYITAINVESGGVLYTPEMLYKKKGKVTRNKGKDMKEYYYTKENNMEIMIVMGPAYAPWDTVIRYPVRGSQVTAESILNFIDSFDNSDKEYDFEPYKSFFK